MSAISTTNVTLEQPAHELIDQLPETATWDDLIAEMRFRKAVEEGVAQADRKEFGGSDRSRVRQGGSSISRPIYWFIVATRTWSRICDFGTCDRIVS